MREIAGAIIGLGDAEVAADKAKKAGGNTSLLGKFDIKSLLAKKTKAPA
jgi:hypothetical protein